MESQILFQSQPLFCAGRGNLLAHIAVVPGLKAVAGEALFPLGVAEDEAVLGAMLGQPGVGGGFFEMGSNAGGVNIQG